MNEKPIIARRIGLLPRSVGGRILFGLGTAFLTLLFVAGIIAGSMWIESRFPSDDTKRSLMPGMQRVVTKPIVNALGRQVDRYMRWKIEKVYLDTGLTLEETIARFLDDRVDLAQRRAHAYRLAHVGSPECIAALLKVFQTAPSEHKAFMAQLIGSTGNPAAKASLLPLLDDADPSVVIATMRGLSAIGGDDVVARTAGILTDDARADSIRVEAALALGTIGTTAARDALTAAFVKDPEEEVATQILNSLGKFEFATVASTFKEYIAATETPTDMRVIAVEALAHSSTEAVPYLLAVAQSDEDEDVRASAAWAIGVHSTVNDIGPALTAMAEQETDADVRRRLYEALLPQSGIPSERLLPIVLAEDDIEARVAGFNAIGLAAHQQPASTVASSFDREIVPELVRIATTPNSLNIQMRAVFALRRAQTPAARNALAVIANSARSQVATAARNGLKTVDS